MKKKATRRSRPTRRPLDAEQLQAVAELFGVLSEPSRLRILQALHSGESSVGELVHLCGIKQANMSRQLGILAAAGIITRRQDGNRVLYRIDMPLVPKLCDLVCVSVAKKASERAKALGK